MNAFEKLDLAESIFLEDCGWVQCASVDKNFRPLWKPGEEVQKLLRHEDKYKHGIDAHHAVNVMLGYRHVMWEKTSVGRGCSCPHAPCIHDLSRERQRAVKAEGACQAALEWTDTLKREIDETRKTQYSFLQQLHRILYGWAPEGGVIWLDGLVDQIRKRIGSVAETTPTCRYCTHRVDNHGPEGCECYDCRCTRTYKIA